ncbi:Xaa-Pro aminopeptidase [Tamilnaduibacter salinus]|uniref:Xaa-Pro aminopeptidase n=1 Tax=Tamilnaduibacter salinus TaxID=1484056 RepID=A0A2A2I432_9GAMM|nr:Xaa-Pro peptidase family protein [Tamilnaduibacter salinus]PAV26771.1 Xaa-Pro aminopeptidase [Tamilnaduibacter salinus]
MDHLDYQKRLAASLTEREHAFPDTELDRRRHALDSAMARAGLDALLITQPAEIHYLTGYNTFEVSVHTALAYRPGEAVLQVPSIETGPAVAMARCDRILGYRWEGPGEILDPLSETLDAMGQTIGLDLGGASLRPRLVDGLREQLGAARIVDSQGILARIRRVKSEAEIDLLRHSARMTESGMAAARDAVRAGGTDSEVAAEAARAMHAAGSEFMSMQPIVVAGMRSSIIHTNHRRLLIEAGDPVFMEMGAACQRYTAPQMHTVIAGQQGPTDTMRRVADTIRTVYETLCRAMVPGRSFDDAARDAETVFAPLADEAFFSGVYGYTVGAQFPPSWVEGSGFIARGEPDVFEADMVFHLPLCFRIPGAWGIGFSETVRVTVDGAEPLTHNDWHLRGQVF